MSLLACFCLFLSVALCPLGAALSPASHWRTGNTFPIVHPLDTDSLIPSAAKALQDLIISDAPTTFLGPSGPNVRWKNASHLFTLEERIGIAIGRWYLAAWMHDVPQFLPASVAIRARDANVWTLCFADDRNTDSSGKVERSRRCDAFRTRSGLVPFGTATIYESWFEFSRGGGRCQARVTALDESQQIFHFNVLNARHAVLRRLLERDVLYFDDDGVLLQTNSPLDVSSLTEALHEGLSLLSIELFGSDCYTFEAEAAALNTFNHDFVDLTLASQNVWNYNGNWSLRRELIAEDLLRLGRVDIFTFQEVRYHSNAPSFPIPSLTPQEKLAPNGKSQSWDLLRSLHRASLQLHAVPTATSFGFYPAMMYFHMNKWEPPRLEAEGPMNVVFTGGRIDRTFIENVVNLPFLLTRDVNDPDDGHQRLLLCTVLLLTRAPRSIRVDVCTSHFSLGENAQNRNAMEAVAHMTRLSTRKRFFFDTTPQRQVRTLPAASFTVFTGDLNSEPFHEVSRILRSANFRDAWNESRRSASCDHRDDGENADKDCFAASSDNGDLDGLTFNTNDDRLVKRIDFVYVRENIQSATTAWTVQDFTLVGRSKGEGEISSDHLGIVAKLRFSWIERT